MVRISLPLYGTYREYVLAFAWLHFISAERFFGLDILGVLACLWIVLHEFQFVWSIHRVLAGNVGAVTSQLAHESNNLALCIRFLRHKLPL